MIDGVARTVDLYRRRHHRRVPFSCTPLGPGAHTITIDAFIVH